MADERISIAVVGGGPGGLYFSILMKKHFPEAVIDVYERNKPDDTFGWGVVFSKATLDIIEEADPVTFKVIEDNFRYWDDILTYYKGDCVRTTGHGFCGFSRKKLLEILHGRCRDLGVNLHFESNVESLDQFADVDLIVAADGINSFIRDQNKEAFEPSFDWRKCKFTWLGTDLPMEDFTFFYVHNEHGLWQAHCYPFDDGLSTFIVETREENWRAAGLEGATDEETIAYCKELFKEFVGEHNLFANNSIWRTFPTVRCERWYHENIVILGDSAHTAHFSIGSGTKLAMESAIALVNVFREHGYDDVPSRLKMYDDARRVDVLKLQKAAQPSLEFYENTARYLDQCPLQFTFNQTTRSKQITWDNLEMRDPQIIDDVKRWYCDHVGAKPDKYGVYPVPMFTPFQMREMELLNRVVMSPMCQYSAEDGTPNDWHLMHYGARATGGVGLIITEQTNVSRDGRITPGCAGIYKEEHQHAWKRIVDFCHEHSGAKMCMQIGHAGRKAATKLMWDGMDEPLDEGAWPIVSASPIPYYEHSQTPRELTRADMDEIKDQFVAAVKMAEAAGFDMIEMHAAHGYLLSSFISPLTNIREDEYGGDVKSRCKFPLEIFDAMREVWPEHKPMSVRISASDWVEPSEKYPQGGLTPEDAVEVARLFWKHGVDIVDVSAGMTTADQEPIFGRMFQVPFSDKIRHEVKMPTMAVGNIQNADQINTIIAAGRADLCALARPHLQDPAFTLKAAEKYGHYIQPYPKQYLASRPRRPK